PAPVHRSILVVGEQDFAGRGDGEARCDDVDRSADIGRENKALRVAAEEARESLARFPEQWRQPADEKVRGLRGELAPQLRDAVEFRLGQAAERARGEVDDARVENHRRPSDRPGDIGAIGGWGCHLRSLIRPSYTRSAAQSLRVAANQILNSPWSQVDGP